MAVATAVVILNLAQIILINLLVQKAGKIEAMATPRKTQNMKVVEVEDAEGFLTKEVHLTRRVSTLFVQVLLLIL